MPMKKLLGDKDVIVVSAPLISTFFISSTVMVNAGNISFLLTMVHGIADYSVN